MAAADYVQYHNTDKLGHKPNYLPGRIGIVWTAKRSAPMNARVWLVLGQTIGGTKRYWLWSWFIVDRVGIEDGVQEASGAVCQQLKPAPEIGNAPWFAEFRQFMGNFGRGFSPLRKADVEHFEASCPPDSRVPSK